MNKASGGDGIPVELFQILEDDAVKVLHSICQQIWRTQQWPQVWKRSVFIPIPKKGNAEECSNYRTTTLISHTSKVMLRILQARLQQYMNCEIPDVQAGFRKGRGNQRSNCQHCHPAYLTYMQSTSREMLDWQYMNCELPDVQAGFRKGRGSKHQIANIRWITEKESSRKTSISALLTMPKPLTVCITINCGKFFKRQAYQTTWPASWKIYMQVRKQQLELDMEKHTGSK